MRITEFIRSLLRRLRALFKRAQPLAPPAPPAGALAPPTPPTRDAEPATPQQPLATPSAARTDLPSERPDGPTTAAAHSSPADFTIDIAPPTSTAPRPGPPPRAAGAEPDATSRRPRLQLVENKRPPKSRRPAFPALDPAIAAVPVRRFFSRLAVHHAAPLTAASWPTLPVERFFLALGKPTPRHHRGPAIAAPQVLDEAFADFVWE